MTRGEVDTVEEVAPDVFIFFSSTLAIFPIPFVSRGDKMEPDFTLTQDRMTADFVNPELKDVFTVVD